MGLKAVANLGGGGGGGTVTGTGTPDTLAKFATASSVGDSVVTESAGAVTITGANALRGSHGFGNVATNFAAGDGALLVNTSGSQNTAIGSDALKANTLGIQNTASGASALQANNTGDNNTASGVQALFNNLGGYQNTATGVTALYSNTTGIQNTASGQGVLFGNTTGSQNTAVGVNTGGGITTGSGNTVLGANVTGLPGGLTNNIILANGVGTIKARHDGTNWAITDTVAVAGGISATGNAAVGYASVGSGKVIASITLTAGGAGYTNGTYTQQALTGGTGSGATADFIVAGGIITTCQLRAPGVGYVAADVLSCATLGAGAGLVVTVATVASSVASDGIIVAPRIGAGTTAPEFVCHVNGGAQGITGGTLGAYGNTLSTSALNAFYSQYIAQTFIPATTFLPNIGTIYYLEVDATTASFAYPRIIQAQSPKITASGIATQINILAGFFSAYRSSVNDISTNANNILKAVAGAVGVVSGTGALTTPTAIAFEASMFNSSATHTITNFTFFLGAASSGSAFPAGATITNFYGMRLQAMGGAGTITNRFPIAQEDTLGTNFFRAKTAFGPATGTAPGDALSSIEITTNGTTNGNLRLNTASAVLDVSAASTNGVKFNNPGTPGITSTTLTNYQDGTFTVADGSGAGLVFTQNMTARYTRVGRNVTVICDITYPATASATPAQVLLPIPVGALTYGGGAIVYSSTAARFGLVYDTVCPLYVYGAAAQSTNAALSGQRLIITMTYVIS